MLPDLKPYPRFTVAKGDNPRARAEPEQTAGCVLREELREEDLGNLDRAREIIATWVEHYNGKRLHAGLGYIEPRTFYSGDAEKRLSERKEKLARANPRRVQSNRE